MNCGNRSYRSYVRGVNFRLLRPVFSVTNKKRIAKTAQNKKKAGKKRNDNSTCFFQSSLLLASSNTAGGGEPERIAKKARNKKQKQSAVRFLSHISQSLLPFPAQGTRGRFCPPRSFCPKYITGTYYTCLAQLHTNPWVVHTTTMYRNIRTVCFQY